MRLFKIIFGVLFAPFRWIAAWWRDDRFILFTPSVIQFIGIPGSGKTMSAVCMMKRSTQAAKAGKYKNSRLYATRDAGIKLSGAMTIDGDDLARYKFKNSIILLDESSLNGFDSREWQHNFKQGSDGKIDKKNKLRQLKLHRHYGNSFITTSQSANDNDSKIRDGLVKQTWICHNGRWWIKCYRAIIWYKFDNGNYLLCVDEPAPIERFIDPYLSYHVRKSKYGQYYDSWATVPEIDNLPYFGSTK